MSALRKRFLALSTAVFALCPALASAADFPPTPTSFVAPVPLNQYPFGIISEVRGGVFAHDPRTRESGSVDLNAEVISPRVVETDTGFWNYFIPRLHLGGNLNTAGKTSDVYTGFTWTFPLYQRIFGEVTFGGSYNDGHTEAFVPKGYAYLGCHLMFRESASVGYHLSDHWSVLATVEHISNAGLCDHNSGITNIGGRVSYAF